jgi:hypothetical protein
MRGGEGSFRARGAPPTDQDRDRDHDHDHDHDPIAIGGERPGLAIHLGNQNPTGYW